MKSYDVIVIGAGYNGLIAAAFLARAGARVLVVEKADRVGGCAVTSEIAPGVRCPTLAHCVTLDRAIVRSLNLERRGLPIIRPETHVCAATGDRALVLWADTTRAAGSIAEISARDAEQYPRFVATFARLSSVLRAVNMTAPPSIDEPEAGDIINLLQ